MDFSSHPRRQIVYSAMTTHLDNSLKLCWLEIREDRCRSVSIRLEPDPICGGQNENDHDDYLCHLRRRGVLY
jgi:hypothetical protein